MNHLPNVYDLFYPSPVTLKKISMIETAIELWRQEIREHRSDNTLPRLDFKKTISSGVLISHAPSLLLSNVDQYIGRFGLSIKKWLEYHIGLKIIQSSILRNFDDFVGDPDGTIHYGRTAERMILCDGIGRVEKFKIACLYCLEEYIELLWPTVSSEFDLNSIKFYGHPRLFYWICRLKNQLYKIPPHQNPDINFEERLLASIASRKHYGIRWNISSIVP